MSEAQIKQAEQLRGFNRFYTQTIGVLSDNYLGRRRPLGASRLLYEIGAEGADIRSLRLRLNLDSGYLSRLLRTLEAAQLVRTRPNPHDGRVRRAELTAKGRRELAELNHRAAAVASALLEPLTAAQRAELVAATAAIERLLRLATIDIEVADPASADARRCLRAYAAELSSRFAEGFSESELIAPAEAQGRAGALIVAREHGRPIGCGALRTFAPGVGEIRHLWVDPAARGLGLSRRLMDELEEQARSRGHRKVCLDTSDLLEVAIGLYRTSGYREVPAYNYNPHAHLWFEKRLPPGKR